VPVFNDGKGPEGKSRVADIRRPPVDNVDKERVKSLDGIMPQTTHRKQNRQSAAAHLALTSRVLKGLNKSIDEQIELACELECERALALYRTGKVTLHDADEIMKEARQRVG